MARLEAQAGASVGQPAGDPRAEGSDPRGQVFGQLVQALSAAGCVAADDEARELLLAARGDIDRLTKLVADRCTGEPLAWLVGSVRFCGEPVIIDRGVFVPRPQSEPLAREAAARLPDEGVAVDLCTGSGAIAVVICRTRPHATVVGTEIDPVAVRCARRNGVTVLEGDMTAPVPAAVAGRADVVTAVVPYVPTSELHLLPRDVLAHEPRHTLDGGPHGTVLLRRAVAESLPLLRPGGSLLLEIGGDQADLLQPTLDGCGYGDVVLLADEDGDVRGLACRRRTSAS